jgi:hypothetical protein
MKKAILGLLVIAAVIGLRPAAKRIARKMHEHCERMAANCGQMIAQCRPRGEEVAGQADGARKSEQVPDRREAVAA